MSKISVSEYSELRFDGYIKCLSFAERVRNEQGHQRHIYPKSANEYRKMRFEHLKHIEYQDLMVLHIGFCPWCQRECHARNVEARMSPSPMRCWDLLLLTRGSPAPNY